MESMSRPGEAVTVYVSQNDIDGKEYVGITRRPLAQREKQHKYDGGRGCRVFGAAIKKHGAAHFHFEEIFVALTWDDACWAEQHLIVERQTRAPKGYNLTAGGEGVHDLTLTPEHKAAVSNAQKGRKHSAAERKKRSEGLLRFHASLSPEEKIAHTAKTAGRMKGKKRSAEANARTAAARKGKKLSTETRQRMSDSRRGKPRSPETWAKIRAGHKRYWEERHAANLPAPPGKIPSAESRGRMSESQKRRFAALSPEEKDALYESRRDGRMSVAAKKREEKKRLAKILA